MSLYDNFAPTTLQHFLEVGDEDDDDVEDDEEDDDDEGDDEEEEVPGGPTMADLMSGKYVRIN